MPARLSRRSLLKSTTLALAANALPHMQAYAAPAQEVTRLCFNENPYGPSSAVREAVARELPHINRYADAASAQAFAGQIAASERIPVEQVVLGEILSLLGLYLGSQGGPGGEFLYSAPGYLALIDSAANIGSVGISVPLNAEYRNDLPTLLARITLRMRALYLVNPHNPSGTVNDDTALRTSLPRPHSEP